MARHRRSEHEDTTVLPAVGDEPASSGEAGRFWQWSQKVRIRALVAAVVSALVLTVLWTVSGPVPALLGALPVGDAASTATYGGSTSPPGLATTGPSGTPTVTAPASSRSPTTPSATAGVTPTGTPRSTPTRTPTPPRTSPPTPSPTPAPVSLVAGTSRSLESMGQAGSYVVGNGSYVDLVAVSSGSTAATKQAATFSVVAGLADSGCVTLRTASGSYLRHRDYRLRVEPFSSGDLFRRDTTFCVRSGAFAGTVSLESVNYPGYYIHRRGNQLWLDSLVDSSDFRADRSFRVAVGWA